jgi:hypothetical protein
VIFIVKPVAYKWGISPLDLQNSTSFTISSFVNDFSQPLKIKQITKINFLIQNQSKILGIKSLKKNLSCVNIGNSFSIQRVLVIFLLK